MTATSTLIDNNTPTLAIKSQRVLLEGQFQPATLFIKQGKIHSIKSNEDDSNCPLDMPIHDVGHLAVMPGIVDTHVHVNEPGRTDWEGFDTATHAAAAGGITTLVDMPLNCIPVTTSADALQQKINAIEGKLWVDCGFWGGVTPESIEELPQLLESGVLGVKSFLIDSGIDEFPPMTAPDLINALPIIEKFQVPYLIHAELDTNKSPPATIGKHYQSFLASRPKAWENQAIQLMIDLAKQHAPNAHIHIVHLSSAEAIQDILAARAQQINITVETCPHYLTLWAEAIPDGKTLFKCCPPIRENDNRMQLWQALKNEEINFIVSDHSPCTPQLKLIDSGDIEHAWGGISALQFSLPLVWHEAKAQNISLAQISQLVSTATAEFAGIGHQKGKIAEGYDADLLIFDDEKTFTIENSMIKHKHKFTPYAGKQVTGEIVHTYLRGNLIFSQDQFYGAAQGRPILKEATAKANATV
ncbi:allantoinase AllB [Flocculibacter collagenilyticus]|uniref:allantoinase AllB n=1 Tax=Flocculibacter collagenilyticus TaxID=2744479 RepID=UPI0018F4F08E|nr:allantoinase AllB [Flocculibacter collagenilyticus]